MIKRIWGTLFVLTGFFLIPHCCLGQNNVDNRKNLKSVDVARHKAVTNTLLPLAVGISAATLINNKRVQTAGSFLAFYGLSIGPSGGNFYAKDYLRGFLGVAARVGGVILIKNATNEIFGSHIADAVGWDKKDVNLTDTKILLGGGVILASAIYNIVSSKASVHRFNRAQGYYIRARPAYRRGHLVPMISARITF